MSQEIFENDQEEFDPQDIEKNKTMAGLAYLIFFLPLIACPDSKFAKFHANQALILWLAGIAGSIILGFIPIIGWILLPVFTIVLIIFGVMGLVNGLGGKAKKLPIVGNYTLIK
ncbi:hypothetical protein [Sedimentibacter sp.]|uniref:DUF4870 domain-containing protein n=1 Tax=Sedimentibacter sp. TaxID=1960295 RepID=UPI00289A22A8|nr:hypothetical protein [Sedimentibacter sp.]